MKYTYCARSAQGPWRSPLLVDPKAVGVLQGEKLSFLCGHPFWTTWEFFCELCTFHSIFQANVYPGRKWRYMETQLTSLKPAKTVLICVLACPLIHISTILASVSEVGSLPSRIQVASGKCSRLSFVLCPLSL